MACRVKFFLTMFRGELENSLDDARYLAEFYEKKLKGSEITNYVYNENEAFLAQEIRGLKGFIEYIDTLSPGEHDTVEDIVSKIDDMIKRRIREYADPGAVYDIVTRKIRRILVYMEEWPGESPAAPR
jgi:hypothetical protein